MCKGAIHVNGRCIAIMSSHKQITGMDAQHRCSSQGFQLASFPRISDLDEFVTLLNAYNLSITTWVGLTMTEVTRPELFMYKETAR